MMTPEAAQALITAMVDAAQPTLRLRMSEAGPAVWPEDPVVGTGHFAAWDFEMGGRTFTLEVHEYDS